MTRRGLLPVKRNACVVVTGALLAAAVGCGNNGTSGTPAASTVEATVPVTDVEPVLPSVEGPLIRESRPRPDGNYDTLLSELAGTFVLRNDCIYIEDVEHHSTTLLIFLYGTTWDPVTQAIGTFGHVGDSFLKGGSWFDPPRESLDRLLDDEGLAAVDRCTAEGGVTVAIW